MGTGKWSDGPNLNIGRRALAAGIVTDDVTNEELVIVSGGTAGSHSHQLKSTEILMDNKWSLGPELPVGIFVHSMVPFGNGQVIIGGWNGQYQGKIYRVTCSNRKCAITKMDQELTIPRSSFVAIPIPDELSGCT